MNMSECDIIGWIMVELLWKTNEVVSHRSINEYSDFNNQDGKYKKLAKIDVNY